MILIEAARSTAALEPLALRARTGADLYQRCDGPGFVAIVVDDAGASTDAGRRLSVQLERGRFGRSAGPFLFWVTIRAPSEFRAELIDWYDREHFAMLFASPLWQGGVLAEEAVGDGCLLHALYSLGSEAALDASERKAARASDWFIRLSRHAWFDKGFVRTLWRRVE